MADTKENLISLASDIAKDSQLLLKQELEILRMELLNEWEESKRAIPYLFFSIVAMIIAGVLASHAAAQWLTSLTEFPLWAMESAVALFVSVAGIVLFIIAKHRLNSLNLIPKVTLQSLKENLICVTH